MIMPKVRKSRLMFLVLALVRMLVWREITSKLFMVVCIRFGSSAVSLMLMILAVSSGFLKIIVKIMKTKTSKILYVLLAFLAVFCLVGSLFFAFCRSVRSSAASEPVELGRGFIAVSPGAGTSLTIPAGVYLYDYYAPSRQATFRVQVFPTSAVSTLDSLIGWRTPFTPSGSGYFNTLSIAVTSDQPSVDSSNFLTSPLSCSLIMCSLVGSSSTDPSLPQGDYPAGGPVSTISTTYFVLSSSAHSSGFIPASQYELLCAVCDVYNPDVLFSGQGSDPSGDYDDGYQAGYTDGLNKGQSDAFISPLAQVFQPVQSFLDMNLFGSVSLGDFFSIAVFVMIALVFLKMFGGG